MEVRNAVLLYFALSIEVRSSDFSVNKWTGSLTHAMHRYRVMLLFLFHGSHENSDLPGCSAQGVVASTVW